MFETMRVVLLVIALTAPTLVWADECSEAVTDYNAVLVHLNTANEKFSACVANSLGTDNCATEFARLRSAYGEFESAVAIYIKQCR